MRNTKSLWNIGEDFFAANAVERTRSPSSVKRLEELPLPKPMFMRRTPEMPLPMPEGGLGKRSIPMPEDADAPACPPKIAVRWIAPRWVATGNTYNAKDTLRSWGFKWVGGMGAWATDDPAVAMKARKCMDPASRVEAERRVKVATPIPEAPKGPQYTMTYEDGYWIVRGNTRDIYQSLKDAGWRAFKRGEQWDGWRTNRPEIANSLRNAATDEALVALDAALRERDDALALSRAANEEDLAKVKPGFTCADIPAPPGLSYRPYQCVGIVYAANRPGVLIGDEPGLGKTIQAIGVFNVDPTIQRVLVICPASLRNVWRDHFERWTVRQVSIYVARNAKEPIPEHANVVIFGFQAAVTRKGEETPAAYADAMKRQWDLLVVDEGHFLKNPEAKRTQAILGVEKYDKAKREVIQVKEGLAHRARRKVFLTGTPLPNRPLEMWPLLHTLAPQEFRSWGEYAYRYTNVETTRFGTTFKGSRNEAELNERMRRHVMIRRLKIDVLKDLPPKQRVIVPFDPEIGRAVMRRLAEGEYAKMLEREARRGISSEDELLMDPEELLERWMSELKEAAAQMRGKNLDLSGAADAMGPKAKIAFSIMAAMRRDLAVAKIPSLIDYVSGILEEKPKVVIMAHHREVQDALVSALVKHLGSADAVVLHRGGMADKDKSESERRFQTDPNVRVFVGSIMASGVGITLTAADQLVMAEVDWVPANNAQAEDRIHRIGQTLPATIHYPLVDGSIEAKLIRTCVEKLNIADRILDDDVRTKMMREPITAPALRPPQNTLETWAFETMVSVVQNPPPRIGSRDMNFAREVASSPYLTDRRWRAAIATAIRLTGGSASRFDAKFGLPTRPPATQLEAWAGRAMVLLADLDGDRAEVRNGEGFSKSDGGEGHALAAMARLGQMSDADWQDAIRLAKRYKRQVGEFRATPDGETRENPMRGRRRLPAPTRRRIRR